MQRSKSKFLIDLHDYLSGHTTKCRVTETETCVYITILNVTDKKVKRTLI